MVDYNLLCTYQLYGNGRAGGQPGVDFLVVEHEQLVRRAPYTDDEGGRDEHVQEHVEDGERSVRPRGVHAPVVARRTVAARLPGRERRWPSRGGVHGLVGRHGTRTGRRASSCTRREDTGTTECIGAGRRRRPLPAISVRAFYNLIGRRPRVRDARSLSPSPIQYNIILL